MELSVFVDESGDFGEYDYHAPYYIISLVFHNQSNDIQFDLSHFNDELAYLNLSNHCVHAGPIIRSEEEYKGMSLDERRKILKKLMAFIRHIDISYKTIYIEKKHIKDSIEATGKLSKQLSSLIRENMDLFCSFDVVKIYYDNGQVEVTRVLSSVFNALLENVEFRKVIPSQYRLFQVADLISIVSSSWFNLYIKANWIKIRKSYSFKIRKSFFWRWKNFKEELFKTPKKERIVIMTSSSSFFYILK